MLAKKSSLLWNSSSDPIKEYLQHRSKTTITHHYVSSGFYLPTTTLSYHSSKWLQIQNRVEGIQIWSVLLQSSIHHGFHKSLVQLVWHLLLHLPGYLSCHRAELMLTTPLWVQLKNLASLLNEKQTSYSAAHCLVATLIWIWHNT